MINGISVIMPIYNQAYFIRRAVISLLRQSYQNWELIIINDGSTDCVESMIHDFLKHPQIKYTYNKKNTGLGHALNQGISNARYDYIAYLPADDYYYANHLKELKSIIENNMDCVLAFSGIKYQESNSLIPTHDTQSLTLRNNYCLQLVQVVHKKTEDRWMERAELVTDDLFIMFWKKLADKGSFMPTFHTTCYWTQHPLQRHKICSESYGGNIYRYKFHYRIEEAIRIRMSKYKTIDEYESYTYLKRNNSFASSKSMKILIVGALSYNPERICALEEQGCELYGLWKPYPRFGFESAGKLAFGNCIDVPFENYAQKVKEINPDIIYGVASSMSVGFVNEIFTTLKHNGIQAPLIWHFKEGPQICIGNGTWEDFIQNYLISDGNIFLNLLTKEWIEQFIPSNDKPSMILDQDPPKIDCFNGHFSTKLSSHDGEIHTVVAGRMIGIKPEELQLLAQNQIHIHLYSESYHSEKEKQYNQCKQIAPNHFHIHKQCSTDKWVEEFSKYDAGWLHCFDSENEGDILRLSWDDLNIPARMGVLAAAGIPMIQKDNTGNKVATQEILEEKGVGILFQNIADLVTKLHDRSYMEERNKNIKKNRAYFAFDSHLPELIAFFKEVIKKKMETNKSLQIINNAVLLNSQRVNNIGLVSGTMGICLFMYEYARLIKCSRYEEVADMLLDEVMDNMNQCSHADFYSGTPGISWGVNYLLAHGFAESEDEDMMEEMNETVKQEIFKLSQSESPSIPSLFPHLYFKERKEVYPLLLDSLSRILTKETYFPPSALLCATYLLNKINSEQSIPVSVWDNLDRQIEKLKYQTQTERMMLQTLRKKSLTDLVVTCKKPEKLGELAYQALLYDFKLSLAFDETAFEKYLQELLSNSNEQDYLLNGLSGIGLVLLKGICTYEKR